MLYTRDMQKLFRWIRHLPKVYSIGGALIIIVIVLIVGQALLRSGASSASLPAAVTHVQLSSVAGLSTPAGPLPVTGQVTSLSEATILAQTSGELVALNVSLGDQVGAGEVIAEFENSSQQAAMLQAQGAYEAAQAALAKAGGSGTTIATLSQGQATQSIANARLSAASTMQSAYASMDDAVHNKADLLFTNPRSNSPLFNVTASDSQLAITIQNERAQAEITLTRDAALVANLGTTSDIDSSITTLATDAQTIQTLLSDITLALTKAIPTAAVSAGTISASQVSVGAGRSAVVGAISSLAGSKTSYDAAVSSAAITNQQYATGGTTGQAADLAAAQANVKQAQGALNAAKANLEKTRVRSPISGTIISLPVSQGDFVSVPSQIAVVSNPNALEVKTYVTPEDAKTITVGGKATIEGSIAGTIVSIAPALDPTTNKIEVRIGLPDRNQNTLTDGETVTIALERATKNSGASTNTTSAIRIPIIAIKMTPQGAAVFTVASSTLSAHPVTLGDVVGDQVTITNGLTPETAIVTDARGLSDGQVVQVDTQ